MPPPSSGRYGRSQSTYVETVFQLSRPASWPQVNCLRPEPASQPASENCHLPTAIDTPSLICQFETTLSCGGCVSDIYETYGTILLFRWSPTVMQTMNIAPPSSGQLSRFLAEEKPHKLLSRRYDCGDYARWQ